MQSLWWQVLHWRIKRIGWEKSSAEFNFRTSLYAGKIYIQEKTYTEKVNYFYPKGKTTTNMIFVTTASDG